MLCYHRVRCCHERSALARVSQRCSVFLGGMPEPDELFGRAGSISTGCSPSCGRPGVGGQGVHSGQKLTGRPMPSARRAQDDRLDRDSPNSQ